jgi:hypothetical protein
VNGLGEILGKIGETGVLRYGGEMKDFAEAVVHQDTSEVMPINVAIKQNVKVW